jgi:hypothetical protein
MDRPEGARIYNQIRPIISEHPYDGADARRDLYESNTTMPRGEPVGPDFKQAFTDAAENVEKTANWAGPPSGRTRRLLAICLGSPKSGIAVQA